MKCTEINYDYVAANIPHALQSLYNEDILNSITLPEIRDAFRINQMQGKAWLLNEIQKYDRDSSILVIGSWMGFTSYCLYKLGFSDITETDPDTRFGHMSMNMNQGNKKFKHLNQDVNDLDLDRYNIIINTSCEHISDDTWFDRIIPGTKVALHSTNLKWHDHVNTVENLDEMKNKYNLNLSYSGELVFNPTYSRFMLVGTKT